jgi:ribose transport system ATP-binding protein
MIAEMERRLVAAGVTKRYGAHLALSAVDFELGAGEIVAVVGENGAGKSTFSKIVGGAIRPDAGRLSIDGIDVRLTSPREALRAGVSYIPQELSYLPNMTVADNLLVARWPNRLGFTNRPLVREEAERVAAEFGIDLDVTRQLSELPLAERQLAEILKALARDAKVLVLDEPTASLTSEESGNLFRILRRLASSGVGMIFISHRLDEVFVIADRIVVLRNGRVVADLRPDTTTPRELIRHMLGAEIAAAEASLAEEESAAGAPVLELTGWTRAGLPNIAGLDLRLREGEVLGLFGPRGSGADLVADSLGGRVDDFRGRLIVKGAEREPFTSPRDARASGIGYVPPERKRDGLVLGMSIQENLSMLVTHQQARAGVLNRSLERRRAEEWRERLDIRCRTVSQRVDSLSGGNQQKVLLGSRLEPRPEILVLNEPTRGVDVGARAEIHEYLRAEAAKGLSILWVTSDVEEAVLVSDRLLVMREGEIVGELAGADMTQHEALALATGDAYRHGEAA